MASTTTGAPAVGRIENAITVVLVLALSYAVALGPTAQPAIASSVLDPFVGMPAPEALEAPQSTGTTVRLFGRQRLYRFDVSGRVTNQRLVDFGRSAVLGSGNKPRMFGSEQYLQLTSGRFSSWWVRAPNARPDTRNNYASGTLVRLERGVRLGVHFFAGGTVRLRHELAINAPTTYSASARATFNGRNFFLLTSGPLAGKWVSANSANVLGASQSLNDPQPTASPAPTASPQPTAAPAANWKGVVLVYRETDVTYTRENGTAYHMTSRMSGEMHDLVLNTLQRFGRTVKGWSNGLVTMNLDIVEVPHPVTALDEFGAGYWLGPRSVREDINRYAPAGSYDSIFVVWKARDDKEKIPVGGWGLTLPPGSWANGAGYSSIITPSDMWWWTDATYPEEVFVHEWMHQVLYWQEQHDRLSLDLHAGGSYGYEAVDGTWKRWLSDVMQGKVRDGSKFTGVNRAMWAADQPTKP